LKTELEMKLKEAGLDVIVEAVTTHMTAEGEKPIDHDADPTVLLVFIIQAYSILDILTSSL
jgi:hypothetical protein